MIFDLRKNMSSLLQKQKKHRAIFMGTGPFAVPSLRTLVAMKDVEVVAVVTKPDATLGRRNKKKENDTRIDMIKEFTITNGITILQPEKISTAFIEEVSAYKPDVIVVASYGKILPQALLDVPEEHGVLNLHASLLPELRGASPIQNAILAGKEETGVTLMKMDKGLDTGAIIAQSKLPIENDDTAQTLEIKLADLAAEVLEKTLGKWLAGGIQAVAQKEEDATLCQLIERSDGHISWIENTQNIYNRYRALTPWPGIFAFWKKGPTDFVRIKLVEIAPLSSYADETHAVGEVFVHETHVCARTADGAIILTRLQREGGAVLSAKDFLNGNKDFVGAVLE